MFADIPCPLNTAIVNNILYSKIITPLYLGHCDTLFHNMKKLLTLFLATGLVVSASAQDAAQPKGSWYLGTGDATTLLNLFSTGVTIAPTVGYSVADDIVLTAKAGFGGTFDALDLSLGGQYFMGDYYLGLDVDDPINNLDLGINAGRYIDFKDVLYVAPQLNVGMLLNDPMVGVSIGFGARF